MGKIESIDQLRSEIAFLKIKRAEEEIYLNQTFLKVNKAFSGPINFIRGALEFLGLKDNKIVNPSNIEVDWVTSLGRIVIPFLLNNTLLKGKGVLLKTIVSLLSQSTINSKNLNKSVLANWIDKIAYWVNVSINSAKKKPQEKENDYGISPESETYSGKPIH